MHTAPTTGCKAQHLYAVTFAGSSVSPSPSFHPLPSRAPLRTPACCSCKAYPVEACQPAVQTTQQFVIAFTVRPPAQPGQPCTGCRAPGCCW